MRLFLLAAVLSVTACGQVPAKLTFLSEPVSGSAGVQLAAVHVGVEDTNGSIVTDAAVPITLTLRPLSGNGTLGGTLKQNSVKGKATFGNLIMAGAGGQYQLLANSPGLPEAASVTFSVVPAPSGSIAVPAANACQSTHDLFYGTEPGVYAYWALCEAGLNPGFYDSVGPFDLRSAGVAWGGTWGSGTLNGGAAGPVADGETAVKVGTAAASIQSIGMPVNGNDGSIAAWVNANATQYPVSAVYLGPLSGNSYVQVTVHQDPKTNNGTLCFDGTYRNTARAAGTASACGYAANGWHRVAMTWTGGTVRLYVDGVAKSSATYAGGLDNQLFTYRLFPGCCDTGQPMTLAKVAVANQAWSATQAAADYAPVLPVVLAGGVHVSSEQLGAIHRDVLGYADNNADISNPNTLAALLAGLKTAGVTVVRYGNGFSGIAADQENWRGGATCGAKAGALVAAQNTGTANTLDTYLPKVASSLGLHVGFTVNYGTNPPQCDGGGDAVMNGGDLVAYANGSKHYGIKYWEVGNEVYSYQSETDFHASPNSGTSYVANEPAFYQAMKAQDPNILIGVPIGQAAYDYQTNFDLPVLAGAKFDSIIWHNYPMADPISDGATLYPDRVASNLHRTRGTLLRLQTELLNVGKSADAIWVTEWSGDVLGDEWSRQTMGAVMPIFAATQLAEYMQAGVQYATWYAQGMSNACYNYYYDWSAESAYNWWDCGNASLVYTGNLPGEVQVGLKPGDLTPAARGFQILSESGFVAEGEHMLRTQVDVQNAPWLMSYAATHGSTYAVILINRDRDNAHTVPVTLNGKTSGSSVTQWSYGRVQYDQSYFKNWSVGPVSSTSGSWSGNFHAVLPPLSVNIFLF